MKSRVDIFRPLARRRPESTSCTTSIFRRGHHHQPTKCASSESESYVVISAPPEGQWPPRALSSTSECTATPSRQPQELDRSAPLPTTGTTSSCSGCDLLRGSPPSASRNSTAKEGGSTSESSQLGNAIITPPTYYKIELVKGGSGNGADDIVQLTAGDDSSVQITPDHNEQLQLAASNIDCSARRMHSNIIRASPIVEHEAIEHDEAAVVATTTVSADVAASNGVTKKHTKEESSTQRWTISDHGKIIAIPPSPSSVSVVHFKKPRHYSPGNSPIADRADVPPLLVKASSSSSSSADSFLSDTHNNNHHHHKNTKKCMPSNSQDSESLESPPRLDRSIITASLFEDSVNGSSRSSSATTNNGKKKKRSTSNHSRSSRSTSPSCSGGGCGTRFEFLYQILDVFSLNGPCCAQSGCMNQDYRRTTSGCA